MKEFKTLSVGNQIDKARKRGERHLHSGETQEISAKTTEKPVDFVGVIHGPTNHMELVTKSLERADIFSNNSGTAFYQLKFIFEMNFSSLQSVIEGILQGKPDLSCCGKPNNLCHGFFGERGTKEAKDFLINNFPRQVFVTGCLRSGRIKLRERDDGAIDMTKQILTLKKGKQLTLPEEIVGGGKLDCDHVD